MGVTLAAWLSPDSDSCVGVLQRHESLAANLGAKLVGPLLVKSFEKLFEGPIKILQTAFGAEGASITWLDIVEFARTKPNLFTLNDATGGGRVCQFWIKNCRVQISEDDYRLLLSGAPERMIPTQPIAEDEIAELGTMEILEQRLIVLIRKADLVAGRARQLNYHLKGRKTAIQARRTALQPEAVMPTAQGIDSRQSSTPFQAVNNRSSGNGENQALHQDLLRQFLSDDRKSVPSKSKPGRAISEAQHIVSHPSIPSHHDPNRHLSQPQATVEELTGGQYRPLMTAKNEKLARGEPIWPPCDRCRRLRMDCTKYLTACAGCTKKHAKCTWNDITGDEISYIAGDAVSAAAENVNNGTDLNVNLDPGLRVGSGGGDRTSNVGNGSENGGGNGEGSGNTFAAEMDEGHSGSRNGMGDEQALLSRMASTAAAAATE